ncbi:uncharacterized protein LOC131945040 isoform X2 [Physella acuta]|uniref:uncharacterized protein LOC131945040 isoform X2 n=1 Tax=Physella acuta TaxID=109671 RepID=UPI0027DC5939|nr:uncharacterized protein LOC131945040 isoform X2 [Physella acuta]
MSGAALDGKRKRKRKTKSERNQMSRHHLDQDKLNKKDSKNKKQIDPQCEPKKTMTYTRQSGKESSQSCLPYGFVKATGGAITQGRLTRALGMFSNSKTSDLTKRGPLPETEEMKKKVANDLKRILNLSGNNNLGDGGDKTNNSSAQKADEGQTTGKNSNVMEVDPPATSSHTTSVVSIPALSKQQTDGDNTAIHPGVKSHSKTKSVSKVSAESPVVSPLPEEEMLEPEPPIQEIADKIMKELKPKFDKLFPNRDIEMEICCDLQKLLKQSSCKSKVPIEDQQYKSTFACQDYPQTPRSNQGLPDTSSSTLSACRPYKPDWENKHSLLSNPPKVPHLETSPRAIFHKGNIGCQEEHRGFSSLPSNLLLSDIPEQDEIIHINMNQDDSGDSEDDDDVSGLSIVRYNEFIASARQLEAEQRRLRQLDSAFAGATSQPSFYYPYTDHQHFIHRCCGPAKADVNTCGPRGSLSSDSWRGSRAARVLDFSEPAGYTHNRVAPLSCPIGNSNPSLYSDHHHHHHHHQPHDHHYHCYQPAYVDVNNQKLPQCIFGTEQDVSSIPKPFHHMDRSYRAPFLSPSHARQKTSSVTRTGVSLAQSRYNFQEALNSACNRADNPSGFMSSDNIDWDGCSDGPCGFQEKRSHSHPYHSGHASHLMARPLSELQTHQADLQQAKDFLDDLDRSKMIDQPDLTNHAKPQPRQLFQAGSPDSNGSPVWMSTCLIKDFGLEAAGFV